MNFRLAQENDISNLNMMYEKIIQSMVQQNIDIWVIVNPRDFFAEDIKNNRLYLLEENNEILGAFTVFDYTNGEKYINWINKKATPLYINRLGVNPDFKGNGIGAKLIENAIQLAKNKNFDALRLLVVDINLPAVKFYTKNGFLKSDGVYDDVYGDITLIEYGYEYNI